LGFSFKLSPLNVLADDTRIHADSFRGYLNGHPTWSSGCVRGFCP
jgi:hypothetical protein